MLGSCRLEGWYRAVMCLRVWPTGWIAAKDTLLKSDYVEDEILARLTEKAQRFKGGGVNANV